MKLDDIDPVSETIVGAKLRRMPVRQPGQALHLFAADTAASAIKNLIGPIGAESLYCLD
jgi:hypothetical protein